MKRLYSLWILITFATALSAQTPSSCNAPSALLTHYDSDVKHLALQRIYNQGSSYMDSIEIPLSYQDTIWQALAAVFNLQGSIARDTVFDIYCIHQDVSYYLFNRISVSVAQTCPWLQQWQNKITPTGVPALDTLLSTYGFTVTDFLNLGSYGQIATLTTTQKINVTPLCNIIATFDSVEYAEAYPSAGFGNQILYADSDSSQFLSFGIGYGDCPSGCTSNRYYNFEVFNDCSVLYQGAQEYGLNDVFPQPVYCNITNTIETVQQTTFLHLYPNPADDFVKVAGNYTPYTFYKIINMYGQVLQTDKLDEGMEIPARNLSAGEYIVLLYDKYDGETGAFKLIKK